MVLRLSKDTWTLKAPKWQSFDMVLMSAKYPDVH